MDAIGELEYSQIRRLKSMDHLAAEDTANEAAAVLSSRPPSRHSRNSSRNPATGREKLDVAPPGPSDLDLDQASLEHTKALIRENIKNVGLTDRTYEDLLDPIPLQVIALINAEVIHLLYKTHQALLEAAQMVEAEEHLSAPPHVRNGRSDKARTPSNTQSPDSLSKVEREKSLSRAALKVLSDTGAQEEPKSEALDEGDAGTEKLHTSRQSQKLTKFLICVSEDTGFPRSLRFEPGIFEGAALFQHDDDDHNDDKAILQSLEDEYTQLIGGTIFLKGPEREWNRIEKILTLLIFAVCHLKIEMHLLRDHLCPRPVPPTVPEKPAEQESVTEDQTPAVPAVPPRESPEAIAEQPLSPLSPISPDLERESSGNRMKTWSKGGFVNFLLRRQKDETSEQPNKLKKRFSNKLKMHRTRSITRRSGELGRSAPFSPTLSFFRLPGALPGSTPFYDDWEVVAPETSVVVEQAQEQEEQTGEPITAPASPVVPVSDAVSAAAAPLNPNERFLRVIERLQQAILSVSPDVHYPPPALLVQLRQEEIAAQQNELARVRGRPLLGRVRSFRDTLPKAIDSPFSSNVPLTEGLPTSSSSPHLATAALSPPITQKQISIDTRAGLASLIPGNNSLDGTLRHQSLSFLVERALINHPAEQPLCRAPLWNTSLFYSLVGESQSSLLNLNLSGDMSLASILQHLLASMNDLCASERCGKPLLDHSTNFIHDSHKLAITTKASIVSSARPKESVAFYSCQICSKRSLPTALSEATLLCSFSKYLELLIYSERFVPPVDELCEHAQDKLHITRILHCDGNEVHIRLEKLALYELRLPTTVQSGDAAQGYVAGVENETCEGAVQEAEGIHLLPGQNGLVIREKEISSVIASTLASPAYREFMASNTNAGSPKLDASLQAAAEVPLPASAPISRTSTRPASPTRSETGDPDEKDFKIRVKAKKIVKPIGSILSLKSTSPRLRVQDTFSPFAVDQGIPSGASTPAPPKREGKEDDDSVLADLLASAKVPATSSLSVRKEKGPALPSLIAGLSKQRQPSQASSITSAATPTSALTKLSDPASLEVLDHQHERAGSIRSVSTVASDISVASHDSRATVRDTADRSPEMDTGGFAPSSQSKGSTLSSLSGFLHRNLRLPKYPAQTEGSSLVDEAHGPHIKQSIMINDTKLSCTVYYAERYRALRQACEVSEELFTDSLSRCDALAVSGGKTSAGFWLTRDKRFVLKEMRTKWHVSELDAMLTFAPKYCDYLLTSKRPSLLVKIFGAYTVKIKDLKTGEIKQKVDLVVMEHLFYEQEVTRKFDMKGIASRVARSKDGGETLWDADWESLFQNRLLIHSHHKKVLEEAIAADTEFLAKNNVMDYSCLVGVDDKAKTLTLGIIDFIGTYTFEKRVESHSKRVLQQGERTIIPPDEYAARFRTALNANFVASPEKWSKPEGAWTDVPPALHCPL